MAPDRPHDRELNCLQDHRDPYEDTKSRTSLKIPHDIQMSLEYLVACTVVLSFEFRGGEKLHVDMHLVVYLVPIVVAAVLGLFIPMVFLPFQKCFNLVWLS